MAVVLDVTAKQQPDDAGDLRGGWTLYSGDFATGKLRRPLQQHAERDTVAREGAVYREFGTLKRSCATTPRVQQRR